MERCSAHGGQAEANRSQVFSVMVAPRSGNRQTPGLIAILRLEDHTVTMADAAVVR